MTKRMFAVIAGLCQISTVAVMLALVPDIVGASPDTVNACLGLALFVLMLNAPLLILGVLSTWMWEIAWAAIARRRPNRG